MKIIAHRVTDLTGAKRALEQGVDFIEVDVAKRFFIPKFTIQHNGLKGKLGIGPVLGSILVPSLQKKLFLDLKQANISFRFASKLSIFLKNFKVKPFRVCGHDWKIISSICKNNNLLPFYTIRNQERVDNLEIIIQNLAKPAGFSIHYTLIDKNLIRRLKSDYPKCEIWAWTVNDLKTARNLIKLGVSGIITDEYELMIKQLKSK